MTDLQHNPPRFLSGLIGLGAVLTLVVQTGVDVTIEGENPIGSLWSQARYFTNLMVFTVAMFFCLTWVRQGSGSSTSSIWTAAITVWIVLVGVVYHALLAATHHPEGLDIGVNLMQHTILPIAVLLYWMRYVPKGVLEMRLPLIWLACPILYVAYVLLRGAFDQQYPYFFLNPDKIGWQGVGAYIVGLGLLFYVAGAALVLAGRRFRTA